MYYFYMISSLGLARIVGGGVNVQRSLHPHLRFALEQGTETPATPEARGLRGTVFFSSAPARLYPASAKYSLFVHPLSALNNFIPNLTVPAKYSLDLVSRISHLNFHYWKKEIG